MLRSFSYAAQSAMASFIGEHATAPTSLSGWAEGWETVVSSDFLDAYREVIQQNPDLLPDPDRAQQFLAAYLLEKALYELLYELNNRPAWLHIPLSGILRM